MYALTHNETLNNNIKEVYEILIFILKNAHKVIFTDAFITEQAFILASIRKQGTNLYINNTYQKFKDVEAIYLKNENEYFEQLLSDMNGNKYFMCLSDTIEGAERIYNYLYSTASDKQKQILKLWTSETDELIKDTNFKIGWHITSPKIIASVDKNDKKNKTNHYIYIKGNSINPELIYQQTARNRNIEKLFYYSEATTHLNKFNSINDIEDNIKTFKLIDEKVNKVCMINDEEDNKVINMNTFYKLYVRNEYKLDTFNTNKLLHYNDILKAKGFKLSSIGEHKKRDDRKKVKKELLDIKLEKVENFIDEVKNDDENIFDDKNKKYNSVIELLNLSDHKLFKDEYIKLFGEDVIIKKYKCVQRTILDEYQNYLSDKYILSSFFKFLILFKTDEYIQQKLNNLSKTSYYLKYLDGIYNKVFHIRKFEKLCKISPFEVENKVEFIKTKTDITDEEWDKMKVIFRNTKTKPENKFDAVKLYKLLLNNICGEINIFSKGVKINKNNIQFYNYSIEKEIVNKLFVLALQNEQNYKNMNLELLKTFKVNTELFEKDDDIYNGENEEQFIKTYLFGTIKNK